MIKNLNHIYVYSYSVSSNLICSRYKRAKRGERCRWCAAWGTDRMRATSISRLKRLASVEGCVIKVIRHQRHHHNWNFMFVHRRRRSTSEYDWNFVSVLFCLLPFFLFSIPFLHRIVRLLIRSQDTNYMSHIASKATDTNYFPEWKLKT